MEVDGLPNVCKCEFDKCDEAATNSCGIHVHVGTTCDDADKVGGHWFKSPVTKDPWTAANGAFYDNVFGPKTL